MERIFVAVRARPLASEESSLWRISGDSIFLPNSATKFDFDRVFGEDSKTVDIFEARTKDIVASVVCGFNGTVFAYGQTSSGKTYTMRGSANEPGIIPLSVLELFYSIHEKMDREFLVRVSYMEIYNEEINDLLAPEHLKLQIHESLERGIYVTGLKEEIVNSPEQVLELVEFGESHRHIGKTNMNLYSSRSHTIFRMIVESRERGEEGDSINCCDAVRVSVLNLVDLAGSERAVKTGADGTRLKEGSHINKSLLTLGTVIKKLSEGVESQGGHVPYRDSKLTRILQPALGGNANTAMICNVTLSQIHADETKCSLLFASRALQVKNCACVNEILTDAALLKRQKKEIEELRAKLLSGRSEHLEEEVLNLRNTLLHSELEKERIALELEEEKKDKAHRERKLLEQAKKIENLSSLILCTERDDRIIHSIKLKRRLTWCPGPFLQKLSDELDADIMEVGDEETELLHPSSSIVQECEKLADNIPIIADCVDKEFSLPDARALLNVTSRRKIRQNCANITLEGGQLVEQLIEFADLFFQDDAKETDGDKVFKLSLSNGEITSHFGLFRHSYNDVFTIMEGCFQFLSILSEKVESFKMLPRLCLAQLKSIISGHESISNFLTKKYKEVELEKELLSGRLYDYQNQICELLSNLENKEKIAAEQVLCHDMEKNELLSQVLYLKKEVSQLSSCSLKREMEALKNELDKSKSKLKDAECKLKNILQEKVKLEGEKAQAEREIKNLQGQRAFLEREVLKQDSLLDSRRESKSDFKLNGNERFEIIAFELEAEISSLKEALEITIYEKEEASVKNEVLNLELEDVANKLNIAYFEMELLKESLERMEKRLADSEYSSKILDDSLKLLLKEKEDMILKLTEALLEVEAEKSSWTFKEKSLCEKLDISNNENFKLLASLSKVHNELNLCKDQCNGFKEKLYLSEENLKRKDPSMTKFSDSGELTEESNIKYGNEDARCNLQLLLSHSCTTSIEIDNLRSNILKVTTERDNLLTEVERLSWLHVKLDTFEGKYDDLKSNAEFCLQELNQRISSFEVDIKKADFGNIEELGELRKKLNSTEVELESCHRRLMESLNEKKKMDVKYREASDMLKNELRTCGQIILDLTNRLSEKT